MYHCELIITGLDDKSLLHIFSKVSSIFNLQAGKIKIKGGIVKISGEGYDGRCVFCRFFTGIIRDIIDRNKLKGTIRFIDCPFKNDIHSKEIEIAREELIKSYMKLRNSNK